MTRDDHAMKLKDLQQRLVQLQLARYQCNCKAVIALEGWDASGKGSLIRTMARYMDPRHLKVWRIGPPSPAERDSHWMRRFWKKVPGAGEIAVFDRSWYGRVLVERVEGLASPEEWTRAYDEIVEWERSLQAEGYCIVKLFLDITKETQLKRFRDRYKTPAKRWKLTPDDLRNRARWEDYALAYRDMLEKTSTERCPWARIDANRKRAARLAGIGTIVEALGQGVDLTPQPLAPEVVTWFEDGEGAKAAAS